MVHTVHVTGRYRIVVHYAGPAAPGLRVLRNGGNIAQLGSVASSVLSLSVAAWLLEGDTLVVEAGPTGFFRDGWTDTSDAQLTLEPLGVDA